MVFRNTDNVWKINIHTFLVCQVRLKRYVLWIFFSFPCHLKKFPITFNSFYLPVFPSISDLFIQFGKSTIFWLFNKALRHDKFPSFAAKCNGVWPVELTTTFGLAPMRSKIYIILIKYHNFSSKKYPDFRPDKKDTFI